VKFSLITLNVKTPNITKEYINDTIQKIVKELLPITYIDYSTFRAGTESNPVSLYIMDKKKDSSVADIKDVQDMKKTFYGKKSAGKYTAGFDKNFDPRFMVFDVHDISELEYKDKFAFRLLLSEKIPVSQYTILATLAKRLSTEFVSTVFSISQEKNGVIECVTKYDNNNIIHNSISKDGSGVIGNYTKANNISINKILAVLDKNIDILMAPNEIQEYESVLADYKNSYKYLQTLDEEVNSKESLKMRNDIRDIEDILNTLMSHIKETPKVISNYMRVFDPSKLEVFKINEVKFNTNQKEFWG
jgi:hypothetical protein